MKQEIRTEKAPKAIGLTVRESFQKDPFFMFRANCPLIPKRENFPRNP